MSGYKEAKEAFVSGSTGGSVWRINSVCATAAVSASWPLDASPRAQQAHLQTTYALWTVLAPRLALRGNGASWRTPAIEFTVLVVPLLLALTAFAAHPLAFNALLLLITFLANKAELPLPSPPLSPTQSKRSQAPPPPLGNRLFSQPFVTVYRAHMMLMTVICILAVDFRVFPREFAKAETWGTSLVSRLGFRLRCDLTFLCE